jgi:2-succinyl-6-hydroxy-2,4-cyclohexadiene-1-carboxylate synthase
MQLAVHRPGRVAGLVLLSTTAGLFELEARAERIRADEALASRIAGWGVEAFVDYWLEQPLFEGFKRLPPARQRQLREQRLDNSAQGLANALRGLGTGAMPPIWGELREVNVPGLVMAGELDEKFASLARTLASILPEGHLSILPDTGHALHLESPLRFLKAVHGFFERLPRS